MRERADVASMSVEMPEGDGSGFDVVDADESTVLLARNVALELRSDAAEIPELDDAGGIGRGGGGGGG